MMRMLLLVMILGAVWYLWKLISEQKAAAAAETEADADPATPKPEEAAATAECPVCKAYVAIDAEGGCGREDCPIPELAAAAMADDEPPRGPGASAPGDGKQPS
jgi:zona occludens toxin (predicted ATPase)